MSENIYKLKAISCISYAYVLAVGNSTKASLNWGIWALPLSFNHSSEMQLLTSDINFLDSPPHIVGFWSGPNPVRGAGKLFQEKPVFLEVRLKKLCDPILIKSLLRCSQTKKIIHVQYTPLYLTTD